MANSDAGTSSGNARGGQYQVFLSFCGRDTRNGFTSILHRDLVNNGIHAFIDNEELRVGEEIGGALLQAIDDSQIYIPIFSRNYASSKWCLRELAKMVDNTANDPEKKKILPVFYDVEPKDVNPENSSLYETAIKEHEGKFLREVESWEKALKKVDKIKGWELSKYKDQAELLDLVVKAVLQELKIREKFVTEDLVGLDGRVADVMKWLDVNYSEVRLLGIHGMGGIGKTTLARVVYNKLYSHFGKCCAFLDDIRETSKKEGGLVSLQKKLLTAIGCPNAAKDIEDVDYGRKRIGEILRNKKALIVLDDVDEKEQIKNLIGQDQWCPGTRIIITTRVASVLEFAKQRMAPETKEVNSDNAIRILPYEMEGMNPDHALQLFKRHAFRGCSLAKDFDSLSKDIVNTTGGLPLALEVIGSLLFGKSKVKWEDTLKQLEKTPHERVQEKLMISYKALNYRQRQIFLDVACFFIDENMTNAKYMWEACEFYPNSEIDVLVEMSLIKIKYEKKFWMHDQLRDLGREIVRQGDPGNVKKWSRVWTSKEFLDFVKLEKRYEDVEALDLQGVSSFKISLKKIKRFKNLRFLRLSTETLLGDFIVSLPKLKWICWNSLNPSCGTVSVPRVHSENLVVLELTDQYLKGSKRRDLIKMATKLKSLAIVQCDGLTRTPDLSGCLDLERLAFEYCEDLKEIDRSIGSLVKLECFSLRCCDEVSELPTSVGNLASLRELDLRVTSITSLPDSIGKLRHLSVLNLEWTDITEIPDEIEQLVELRYLYMRDTRIKQLPNSIGKLKSLCTLDLSWGLLWDGTENSEKQNRWELPKAFGMLEKLEELNLDDRRNLAGEIPDEIGHLSSLRVLNLCHTRINRVPGTINMLSRLSTLKLAYCDEIKELPELPASLVHLQVTSHSLQVVPNLSKLTNLIELELSDGSDYDEGLSNLQHKCDLGWIGRLSKLKELDLCLLNIAAPPMELGLLSLLERLTLNGLDLQPLKQLPPSLVSLELIDFSSTGLPLSNLEILSVLRLCLSRLQEIRLYGLSQLQDLCLDSCDLQSLFIPCGLRKLKVKHCDNMIEIQFPDLPASLEELSINDCGSIGRIVFCGEGGSLGVLDQSESSSRESTYRSLGVPLLLPNVLKKLNRLELHGCRNLLEIQVIGTLSSLQSICIRDCHAMEKLSSVSNLKNLRYLSIPQCSELRVVEGLNESKSGTSSKISDIYSLETSVDISDLKIPDECHINIDDLRNSFTFKEYKIMAQRGATAYRLAAVGRQSQASPAHWLPVAGRWPPPLPVACRLPPPVAGRWLPPPVASHWSPLPVAGHRPPALVASQSEKNKEKAKMEEDAVEPDTELRLQIHPSTPDTEL